LDADWELIQASFLHESPAGKVVDLAISAGDVHRRGRSTCIVRFADGSRLVYKPRPLAVDVHFRTFAEWINRKLEKPQVLVPHTVDRGDYGWSGFITHDPVDDEGELATYYERLGAVLALAFLTGLSDLHSDNIIAHRSWPVLVDLETLLRPAMKNDPAGGAARESNRMLDQSVLATQLLAIRSVSNDEEERLVDMGGIVDLSDQMTPFKVPVWRDLGRVDARLDYAHRKFGSAANMPVLKGVRVPADRHCDAITGGFVEVYRLLQSNKTELRQQGGPLAAFGEDETRVVVRGTSNYTRLLSASFHPDFLQDWRTKRAFLADYLTDPESHGGDHQDLVAAEIRDLWQCDVPYFTARAGDRVLISSQGETLKLRPAESGLDLAFRRIADLSDADLARQCWLIKVMLAKSDDPAGPEPIPLARLTDPFDLCEAARVIARTAADTIASQAIFDPDGQCASWHTLGEVGGAAMVADAALDLYSGLPGIALFLCVAGRVLDAPRYRDLARCALREILTRVDAPDASPREVGGFVGSGGLAYALQTMAADFPDLELGKRAIDLLLTADHEAAADIDVAYGLAGALLSCLTIRRHARIGSNEDRVAAGRLLDRALMIGGLIADRLAQGGASSGSADSFAHGRPGIAAALARLFVETCDPKIEALARRLLNETSDVAVSSELNASWCRGQTGLVLALAEGIDLLTDTQALAGAMEQLAARPMPHDHSLCHGAMGVVASLQATWKLSTPHMDSDCPAIAGLVREISQSGLVCGTINSVVSPGLMDGLAGIGLAALAIVKPDAVPFVLSLDGLPRPENRFR
jgi:type 2 lantibiotic biosynthesis protein LanM